jgi:hypothetical protein
VEHRHHGTNAQILADPAGRLLWTLLALPGSPHGLTAARIRGVVNAPSTACKTTSSEWTAKSFRWRRIRAARRAVSMRLGQLGDMIHDWLEFAPYQPADGSNMPKKRNS